MNSGCMKGLGCAALVLVILTASISLFLVWGFGSSGVNQIESPGMAGAGILLVDWGFQDRICKFFAKTSGRDPVAIFECSSRYDRMVYLQWTKDGQVAVFTMDPEHDQNVQPEPWTTGVWEAGTYDFTTGKATLGSNKQDDAEVNKKAVAEIVAAHGGLADQHLSLARLVDGAKKKWFWQVPPVKEAVFPPLFPGMSEDASFSELPKQR